MKKKTIGALLLAVPFPLLILTLSAFAVSTFLMATERLRSDFNQLFAVALPIVGIISILGILIGMPLGLWLVTRRDPEMEAELKHNPRYAGLSDVQIRYINSFYLAAFFNPLVWALVNKLWVQALLTLIPVFNLYQWIYLAVKGGRLAWEENEDWTYEAFKKRQKLAAGLVVASIFAPIFFIGILQASAEAIFIGYLNARQETAMEEMMEAIEVDTVNTEDADLFFSDEDSGKKILEVVSAEETMKNSELFALQSGIHTQVSGFIGVLSTDGCDVLVDNDGDLLPSYVEKQIGTSDDLVDSDGDGYDDATEYLRGYVASTTATGDADEDGVWDKSEVYVFLSSTLKVDSDGDGVSDRDEVNAGTDLGGDDPVPDYQSMLESDALVYQQYCQ